MHSIEIDFEVFKNLTTRRETEDVSYNDVLRGLLGLTPKTNAPKQATAGVAPIALSAHDWVTKGVTFPSGTLFRATHKGQLYEGKVQLGKLWIGGHPYNSLSAAAVAVTGNPVNGWRFWECKRPSDVKWGSPEALRK